MAGWLTAPGAGRRRAALLALAAAVLVVHGWVTSAVGDRMHEASVAPAMPPRIEVAYVRELAPAAPPVVAPLVVPSPVVAAPRRRAPRVPEPAASAVEAAVSVPAEPESVVPIAAADEPAPAVVEPAPELAMADASVAAASAASAAATSPASPPSLATPATVAAAPASAASGAAAFEWPASTRLSYRLTGYFRGDVEGDAQVEWVHAGARYQVHLDVTIGPSFAPLITRRMSSEGEITPTGLTPRRFDQDTKVVLRDRQRVTLQFEPDVVVLANGERRPSLPGVQDTASQFVQLSYLFTTQPELLRSGGVVEIPLALPRKVARWTYDVLEPETLYTPIGELGAFHLKPRRDLTASAGDLLVEIWFAPTLRYLPVRIRIQQDPQTFLDMLISRRPEIAGP